MTDLIVIGGGAAGMAAAIAAAGCGDRVLVLERMDRIGKKLLATGNGRCNLLNSGEARYHGSRLAESVMNRMGYAAQVRFWQAMGLSLREETEGRVYPSSAQASTVLDVLRFQMDRFHVRVRTGEAVQADPAVLTGFPEGTEATYTYYADAACTQALETAPADPGTYYVKAAVIGVSDTAKLTIAKKANTMTVKAKSPSVKLKAVKKKAQKIKAAKAFTVKKAVGKVTYKKKSGDKKVTIAKNGQITVKKGTKKGTHKITVKVTAAGNQTTAALTKTVTVKIKVK